MSGPTRASSIHVVGERHLVLPPMIEGTSEFETQMLERTFRCSSGESIGDEWVGIPIATLLETVGASGETTHLVVEGSDEFRICVPILDALDGLLAYRQDGNDDDGVPRFVAPAIAGTRAVKQVSKIETVSLDPDDDPQFLEHHGDPDE